MFTFERVTDANEQEAVSIYLNNQSYFSLTDDVASLQLLKQDMVDKPESVKKENKRFFLVRKDTKPVAILDYLVDYPEEQTAYIGLLLINEKRQGHGKAIVHKLEEILLSEGMTKLALAVLLNNQPAGKFWRSLGFRPTKETIAQMNQKKVKVLSYEKIFVHPRSRN